MGLNGARAEEEGFGNFGIGKAARQQAQHLDFARCQASGNARRSWRLTRPRRERVDARQGGRGAERLTDRAHLIEESARLGRQASAKLLIREGKQGERSLKWSVADGRVGTGRCQVLRGTPSIASGGRDFTQEAMGRQRDERLGRGVREFEGGPRGGVGASAIASGPVVPCPRDLPLGKAEYPFAPGEPAVMGQQPFARRDEITGIETQVRRENLKKERLLEHHVAGLGARAIRQEVPNFVPGPFLITAVASEDRAGAGDLAAETGIADGEQVAQDLARFLPATVEDKAPQPCQTG